MHVSFQEFLAAADAAEATAAANTAAEGLSTAKNGAAAAAEARASAKSAAAVAKKARANARIMSTKTSVMGDLTRDIGHEAEYQAPHSTPKHRPG